MGNYKTIFAKVKFYLSNRFILFFLILFVFVLSFKLYYGGWLPSTSTQDLWFYSGLFMVMFSIFFIEPYYTSPKNVITNVIPLLLVFLSIKGSFINLRFWWITIGVLLVLLILSIIAMSLDDKQLSAEHWINKASKYLKSAVVTIGTGKTLYSAVFIYFLLTYYSIQNFYTIFLFLFWAGILALDPKKIHNNFVPLVFKETKNQIGNIFSVQSKKIFLVKLFEDRKAIKRFDIVKFRYSMLDSDDLFIVGIVFDTYLLNQEKWAKILQLKNAQIGGASLEKNVVYKITEEEEIEETGKSIKIDDFIGIVIDGSTIGKIKFEYSKKQDNLQEGDLLELLIGTRRLFYQVIRGVTEKKRLEARNETGFIEGEAIQVGEWNDANLSFQKFGWVPPINTPIFIANTSDIKEPDIKYPYYKLGVIPGTKLPSIINLSEAVSHHLGLLGITGSGKTYLTQKIVEELKEDTKIICIDFTGEWKKTFDGRKFKLVTKDEIEPFLDSNTTKLGIYEPPPFGDTTDFIKDTQKTLEVIFTYARKKYDEGSPVKIALVLEEAHTITPETSFLGDFGDYSKNKAVVNKMTQIALQGRKYGVGLIVLAQRTANVSKTVLTQCNTVICFQAFDQTSFNFLGNYVGNEMIKALPNLKQYYAVVAGKAIISNMPMIIDLKRE